MKEGYMLDLVIYETKVVGKDKHGIDVIDYDLVIEEDLAKDRMMSKKDAITSLVVIRDALEHYEGVLVNLEYKRIVLKAMSGVDEALKQLVI